MFTVIINNETRLENLTKSGNCYVSKTKFDEDLFDGSWVALEVIDEERGIPVENLISAQLIQQVEFVDGWYLVFREITGYEMEFSKLQAQIEYLAMMMDIDLTM